MISKCCKNMEFKGATRTRTCFTMLSRDFYVTSRDLELVGSHVMSLNNNSYKLCDSNSVWLTKATFTTSLSTLFKDEFVNLW